MRKLPPTTAAATHVVMRTNYTVHYYLSRARSSKAPEIFRARKAIFSSTVSKKNGEVYTPEISCMKGTPVQEYEHKTAM